MAENTPAVQAETPVVYKRFAQADKISHGTTSAALSLNDYIPGQHVTGPNNNDIAATLAQVQAIPIGTAVLSGNTYNVTISNYPNTATIYPGQKISVQFNSTAPTAEDTALNLSAFGKSLPMCARGVRMGRNSIKSGMILEFTYRADKWNADYDVVEVHNNNIKYANGEAAYSKDGVDGALTNVLPTYLTYVDYDIDLSYTAGIIGTRGSQKGQPLFLNNKEAISLEILNISDSSKVFPIVFFGGDNKTMYVNGYRTSNNAETVSITIRVTYRNS